MCVTFVNVAHIPFTVIDDIHSCVCRWNLTPEGLKLFARFQLFTIKVQILFSSFLIQGAMNGYLTILLGIYEPLLIIDVR